jgi:hypothetical protein
MNKTIITALVASAMAMSAFSQSIFSLTGGAGTLKFDTDDNPADAIAIPISGTIAGFGSTTFQIWTAAPGTSLVLDFEGLPVLTGGWTLASSSSGIKVTPAGNGTLTGGTITVSPTSNVGNVEAVLVGWTGSSTSLASAENGQVSLLGATAEWLQATASGSNPTPGTTAGFPANALVLEPRTPEPSTIAIGGLGAAALLYFRRRK